MFKHAIVRPPPISFRKCISSHPLLHSLDLGLAIDQHQNYCRILSELGIEVIELPVIEAFPDSCFVEDTAIIFNERAVITRMARESRRGEEESIEEILHEYKHLNRIISPGTIEGGDVIHRSNSLIVGITQRTNNEGVTQASKWLNADFDTIEDSSIIHLKSHVTFLDENTAFVTTTYKHHPTFKRFNCLLVPVGEEYAANTLSINGAVLMASRFLSSIQIVKDAGFDVVPIDMSEFEKCEGAITCLSILF